MDKQYSNVTTHNGGYWNKKAIFWRGRKIINGRLFCTSLKTTAKEAAKALDLMLLKAGFETINNFYKKK